jgi:hypothetical protein
MSDAQKRVDLNGLEFVIKIVYERISVIIKKGGKIRLF